MLIKMLKNEIQKKSKVLIVFDDMIADIINNKKNKKQQRPNCLLDAEN